MPVVSKGSILSVDVATVLTAVAEVLSINVSGAKSETFETHYINQSAAGKTKLATGFADPPTVQAQLFYIPTNTGHQALTDEITTPTIVAANQLDGQITFADSGPSTLPFKIAGIEFGLQLAMNDGVKADVTFEVSGQPTWPT